MNRSTGQQVNRSTGQQKMVAQSSLLSILMQRINDDSLILPSLPEIVLDVRKAADDPDITLVEMAQVVSRDPALAARLVKIANSALMSRSVKVTSVVQAVTRIGLRQIKSIATAMAMEQLFVSQNNLVKDYMDYTWQHTINVACQAISVAYFYRKRQQNRNINTESVALAALTYNIGVLPILTEAENYPEVFANPPFLAHAIDQLGGKISSQILYVWDFSDEFIDTAKNWTNLDYQSDEVTLLDFVRIGELLQGGLSTSDKTTMLNHYVEKGVLCSTTLFEEDDYRQMLDDVQVIFS